MILRFLGYLLCLYFALLYSVLYETYDGLLLEVILIALPVISFIFLLIIRLNIKVYVEDDDIFIRRGNDYSATIIVHNRTPFPINLVKIVTYEDGKKEKWRISVDGHIKQQIALENAALHCEMHKVILEKLYIYDYFKLFRLGIRCKCVAEVTVLPRLFDISDNCRGLFGSRFGDTDSSLEKKGNDRSEIVDVREYQDGDNFKFIHQKLSYSMNKFIVKEFAGEHEQSYRFFIRLLPGSDEQEKQMNDFMLDTMYGIMNEFLCAGKKIVGIRPKARKYEMEIVNINDLHYLDCYFKDVIGANAGMDNQMLYVKDYDESINSPYYFFAADIPDDFEEMEEYLHDNSIIFVPDVYKEKMETYRNLGYEIMYITSRGGEELCLEKM